MSNYNSFFAVPEGDGPEDFGAVLSRKNSPATAIALPDGRVDVQLNERAYRLTKKLQKRFRRQSQFAIGEHLTRNNKSDEVNFQFERYAGKPRLNIAIHVVGSRGDVQPFVAIGQILSKAPYSHRVRICTHPVFKDFVEENGLEFFSIGGDPAVLMAYMVKNPGLMPGMESWKSGEIGKRRADIAEILEGCWRSCIQPGNGMGGERIGADPKSCDEAADRLFIADAIIANPPSYGHMHCAEKLGIPLHMVFTMPWSPTQYFPHPLAHTETKDSDPNLTNFISYTLMELIAWQGLGDVINGFRMKTLHLDPISPLWGHMLLAKMKIPFTYVWSQALIPKPPDWGSHINISGFSFLSAPSSYKPPEELVAFLDAGPPPVYIGFGSIVVDNPSELTSIIFAAVKRAGVRALISKGWGGLGGESPPEGVLLIGNTPHDWLFQHVSCVVHHGGAGTTAIGIAMGKPTVIVPFFGDQPFWGAMIYRAGAGPEPVPYKKLTEEILSESITKALGSDIKSAVEKMSQKIAGENGAARAVEFFHQAVNMDSMRCLLSPERVAVWRVKKTKLRLSGLAASTLIDNGLIELSQLKLVRHREWLIDEGASTALLGAIAFVSGTLTSAAISVKDYSRNLSKAIHGPRESMDSESTTPPTEPEIQLPEEFGTDRTQFLLHTAAAYPPELLETIAQRMASKSLPKPRNQRNQSKRSKTYSGSSVSSSSTARTLVPKKIQHHEHGRWHDAAAETSHFAASLIGTGLKTPVSFFYNIANGLHNGPSLLFHDDTVRRRGSITGFGSGVRVAARGFTLNLYDAVTGVVTQPYSGARKGGITGLGKGVVKGMSGLVVKPVAAIFALPAYTLKGLERQSEKRLDRQLKAKILEARLRQGVVAYRRATDAEKGEILRRWEELGSAI